MKIINQTHYVTADLRAILLRAADLALKEDKRKHVVVTVVYGRATGSSGCATIGGYHARIRISKRHPRPDSFAYVAVHEYRHLNGWSHAEMKARYSLENDLARYAWANALPLRIKAPTPTVRPGTLEKLTHARRMFARALTRLKRAQTLARKWKTKVRYYERKHAQPLAATSPESPTRDDGRKGGPS